MTRDIRARNTSGALLLAMAAVLATGAAAQESAASVREDFGKLVACRDGLLKQLSAATAAGGAARDFVLWLDEAADGDELTLILRRRGDRWVTGYGEVPAWTQATMQEWRAFHLGNGAGAAWRPNQRFAADVSRTVFDAQGLHGPLGVEFRLDKLLDDRLPPYDDSVPPGERPTWWDHFITPPCVVPRKQTFTLDAAVQPDGFLFELILDGGIHWPTKDKTTGKTSVRTAPIKVRLQAPSTRFTLVKVQTPTWNGGYHEGDATGLRFANGKLSGNFVVFIHQDGWMPWGGGKTWQVPPVAIRFDVEAKLEGSAISGSFAAVGGKEVLKGFKQYRDESGKVSDPQYPFEVDIGAYKGTIRGRGGRAVLGRYSAEGDLGARAGAVAGYVVETPPPLTQLVPEEKPLPAGGPAAARQAADRVNAVLHHIRALHLALQQYPLPLDEALEQTDTAAPVWSGEKPADAATAAAYCRAAAQMVTALASPAEAKCPEAKREDRAISPGSGCVPTAAEGDVNVLPAEAPEGWFFLPQWQVLGPFEQRLGLEHDRAFVPEIVPLPGLKYCQETDRLGVRKDDPKEWQAVSCETPNLEAPWAKLGFYMRFSGQAWYGATTLKSAQPQKVWLALEAHDFAKLWLNDQLVWTDTEKQYRCRELGRTIVPVTLEAGANRFLLLVHQDRRVSWVRVALSSEDPYRKPAPVAAEPDRVYSSPFIFPDAAPPLAWDLEKGTNIAWRAEKLAGDTRPVVAGDRLLLTSAPATLQCVDAAKGAVRWSREIAVQAAKPTDVRVSEPVCDGKSVWFHAGPGVAACYDLDGKERWTKPSGLANAKLHLYGKDVIFEGPVTTGWPIPPDAQPAKSARDKPKLTGVLLLDAASGEEKKRWTLPGAGHVNFSQLVVCAGPGGGFTALHTAAGAVIDLDKECVLHLDIERPANGGQFVGTAGYPAGAGYTLCANANTLFLTAQDQNLAVRFWRQADGRLSYGYRWESNYEHGGFGFVGAMSVADARRLFTWAPVLERGPHCPNPRLEIQCYDALTGRPLARLKPALEDAVVHSVAPVIAGPYLFCTDSGGTSHGGHPKYAQVVITTADERLQLISRNFLELGTKRAPVFAKDRMFVRSPHSLLCIATTTREGQAYQSKALADWTLKGLAAPPAVAGREVAPLPSFTPKATVPSGKLMDGRTTEHWLGAGPFPAGAAAEDAALAALRPEAGTEAAYAGQAKSFQPLSRTHAYNDPPLFRRQHSLQGTGDIVPFFYSYLDPRACSGPDGTGLFYTVLDNPRECFAAPVVTTPGVTQWLNGQAVKAGETLRLKPGQYAYLVRVAPEFYSAREKEAVAPPAPEEAAPPPATKEEAKEEAREAVKAETKEEAKEEAKERTAAKAVPPLPVGEGRVRDGPAKAPKEGTQEAPKAEVKAAPKAEAPKGPDFRLNPAFKEVPNPVIRERQWLEKIAARKERLQAIVAELPGTDEAQTAAALLERIK